MKKIYDVCVVGGGASGMMAAISAARNGKKVLILEKNQKLGAKLSISGGGRCNITNATYDIRVMLAHYGESHKYLFSTFNQFGVQDTFDFFHALRLPLVVEARNRAFPFTQKSVTVTAALEKELYQLNVDVVAGQAVKKINTGAGMILSVDAGAENYMADHFIFATGGMSHPETGSTGDGYRWLKNLGHTVIDPTPSLVPLACSDTWIHELSGTAFENVRITFFVDEKRSFAKVGKILCTHFGLSGPQILNMSKKVADLLHEGNVTATINLYPDLNEKQLDEKFLKLFDNHKNKMFKTVIKDILPEGFYETFKKNFITEEEMQTPVHSVSVVMRKKFVKLLQALPVVISGLMGYDRAIVADGGIPLEEVDMRTMKSLKISNLSVTGDLLHIMRPSGGFSLQLCWSTGYVAGKNV